MKNIQLAEGFSLKADEQLTAGQHAEAIESFNQCLQYAPNNPSQVLSEAFAGRAKVYFETRQLEMCLESIQCAIDASVCDEKCESFKTFQLQCRENLKNVASEKVGDDDDSQFFKLSLSSHKKIPFIAECLEVRENDVYGRYIMTTNDLNPGDIVVLEEPFYKILDPNQRHTRCAVCLQQNMMNLLPCVKCSDGE